MLDVIVDKPRISRTDSKTGRFYAITDPVTGDVVQYPSVTTILGAAIAKPALIAWAAREERTATAEAAADLYADLASGPQLPRSMYQLALEQRLGKTKAHTKALAKASDLGSAVHQKIDWTLKRDLGQSVGPEPMVPAAAVLTMQAFEEWRHAVGLEPLHIEQIIWSRTHEYAGTLDLVARLQAPALLALLQRQGPVAPALALWLQGRETVTACVDFKTGKAVWPENFLQVAAYSRAFAEMGHGRVDGGLIIRLPKATTDPGFDVVVAPPARELFPTFLAARTLWQWSYQQEQAYQARRRAVA
jgi:hypothetical protein